MLVSGGFIIQAGESYTEATESPFNGTFFSKMEKNEMRQYTQTCRGEIRYFQSAIM